MSVAVAVVGALVVAVLAWLAAIVNTHTQTHLLDVQVNDAAAVLDEAVPHITTSLSTAVAVADATHGDVSSASRYVAPDVGSGAGKEFVSLSIWRLGARSPSEILALGVPPRLAGSPSRLAAFFGQIPAPRDLSVIGLLSGPDPRIGYAVESIGTSPRYVVYAESAVPRSKHLTLPASSAFHQLDIALYLGATPARPDLIETTAPMPFPGPTASTRVAFGTSSLDVVASPTSPLGGGALPALPWVIATVGTVLAAAAALMVEWLGRRRRTAEELALENHRLYAEQRSIAQSLQQALLPGSLPAVSGVEIAARYVPGDPSADIGGDWYDVIRCDERSLIFVVGDVSGRGVPAASTMGSLHFAIRAYAAQGDDAETIMRKLSSLLDVDRDGHFATVVLGHADVAAHQIVIVSAGHPPPLVVGSDGAYFLDPAPGPPVGVTSRPAYVPLGVTVPPGASVIAYTDGLVERRGEPLDVGLERLRASAAQARRDGRPMLDTVVGDLISHGAVDDVALLELRWTG